MTPRFTFHGDTDTVTGSRYLVELVRAKLSRCCFQHAVPIVGKR